MIHKIQYLRKLPVIGMPGGQSLPQDPNIGATPAPFVLSPVNPIIPIIQNTGTTAAAIDPTIGATPAPVTPNGAPIVPNPIVPIIPGNPITPVTTITPVIQYPTPSNLVFHSITDLTATSNQPLVHSRDAAGNIILINDTSSNNQLLTIESLSYTVPNTVLNNVINTQFNYFKFPPRLRSVEVVDEISLTDAIEEVDVVSTRYTPTLTSGRQSGLGRPPVLKAGLMIAEGVDDSLVITEPHGYYGRDNNSYSILNMETVLAGSPQLKPSKFIVTPDLIEAGEDIFFRIKIAHYMNGNGGEIANPHPADPWVSTNGSGRNEFVALLQKMDGPTGGINTVMRTGNYPDSAYIDSSGNLRDQLTAAKNTILARLNAYTSYLKYYNNALASADGDRITSLQRASLATYRNLVQSSKVSYETARRVFKDIQSRLYVKIATSMISSPTTPYGNFYEMLYLIDIKSARPYDEYYIETRCATYANTIQKDPTFWQIVPVSKIKNAFQ